MLYFGFYLLLVCLQIYVVDSLDRERIGKAKQEFQVTYDKFYKVFVLASSISFLNDLVLPFFRLSSMIRSCVIVLSWCLPINKIWYDVTNFAIFMF